MATARESNADRRAPPARRRPPRPHTQEEPRASPTTMPSSSPYRHPGLRPRPPDGLRERQTGSPPSCASTQPDAGSRGGPARTILRTARPPPALRSGLRSGCANQPHSAQPCHRGSGDRQHSAVLCGRTVRSPRTDHAGRVDRRPMLGRGRSSVAPARGHRRRDFHRQARGRSPDGTCCAAPRPGATAGLAGGRQPRRAAFRGGASGARSTDATEA